MDRLGGKIKLILYPDDIMGGGGNWGDPSPGYGNK